MAGKRAPTVPALQEISFNQKWCRNLTHYQALTVGMQLVYVCGDVCVYRYLSVWQKMMCYFEDNCFPFFPLCFHTAHHTVTMIAVSFLSFTLCAFTFCCYSKRWITSWDGFKAEKTHTTKSPLAQHKRVLLFVIQNFTVLNYHFGVTILHFKMYILDLFSKENYYSLFSGQISLFNIEVSKSMKQHIQYIIKLTLNVPP